MKAKYGGNKMTEYFGILNGFIGIGEPIGGIWFVGLEEACKWTETNIKDIEIYKGKNYLFVKAGKIAENASKYGRKFTQVYDIMSKILIYFRHIATDYNNYRNNVLLQQGSGAFQVNLYPLGKRRLSDWPDNYKEFFGFGKNDKGQYLSAVREKRFPAIRQFWRKSNPSATISFGRTHWHDFIELFELHKEEYVEKGSRIRIYKEKKIILTDFFVNFWMTRERIDQVVESLKDF